MLVPDANSRAILKKKNLIPGHLLAFFGVAILSIGTVSIWQHNRDILRDLFDYSTVITSAGKVEAGLKPYTGVRSPMQSSVYLFNYATEQVFGWNYLSLTWGGLIQALGGAWLLLALLWKRTGALLAMVTTAAITFAGLLQHVVFFYNPLGILCFSVVVLGMALNPRLMLWKSWHTWAVLAAMFVGGMNKLNFHGAALLLGGWLAVMACVARRMTLGEGLQTIGLMVLGGLILPIGFELGWTGATMGQWLENVVLMPTARQVNLEQLIDPNLYLQPIFDYHHHMLVRPIGGIGLLLLLFAGAWLGWTARLNRKPWYDWLVRMALALSGMVMGALLMLTNHESVLLTSLAYPVLAVALYLAYRGDAVGADRWMRRVVMSGALLWSIAGGYATWHGSRVLYALDPPARSTYIRVNETTGTLAYFHGVRFLPEQLNAYRGVIGRLEEIKASRGDLKGILFGPGFEWMERSYPQTLTRHEPIWYHAGTTLSEGDREYFSELLGHGTGLLVTQRGWQEWPHSIQTYLNENYRMEAVGSRDIIYHPRKADAPPVSVIGDHSIVMSDFRAMTGSNVMLAATRMSPNLKLDAGGDTPILGAHMDSSWQWPMGANSFQGKAVARLDPVVTGTYAVTFRIIAGDASNGKLLWETPAILSPERKTIEIPFSLHAQQQPVWFQVLFESGEGHSGVIAGWREMRITYATTLDDPPALPFNQGLIKESGDTKGINQGQHWYVSEPIEKDSEGWRRVTAEHWRRYAQPISKIKVTSEFAMNPADPADPVVVALAWYRAGRFEILSEQMIDLRLIDELNLRAYLPEPTGWLGLLVRPAGGKGAGHRVRIVNWDIQ